MSTGSQARRTAARAVLLLAPAIGLLALLALWPTGRSGEAALAAKDVSKAGQFSGAQSTELPSNVRNEAREPLRATPSPSPSEASIALLEGEAAREAVHALSITYEPAAVAPLAAYLAHPDPEIREEAREALVQLGERDAIAWLRRAADASSDADEARALREAADYLTLPTWTERRAALKESATASGPARPLKP